MSRVAFRERERTQAGGRGFVSMTTSKRESKREWRMGALDIRPENARDPDQEGGEGVSCH